MRLVMLTGAGVSAESGLGTFRDPGGIWARYDPMRLATPEGFAADPELVHDFYNARRRGLIEAGPNAAHAAVARLEAGIAAAGGDFLLVTQNIDDLHERAGARAVHHLHGELLKARCGDCGHVTEITSDLKIETVCVLCGRKGAMRPHVVWFGEIPFGFDHVAAACANADVFVAAGTSGSVHPAAGLVMEAKIAGARTVELNLEPSDNAGAFDEARYGPASVVIPAWVEAFLAAL